MPHKATHDRPQTIAQYKIVEFLKEQFFVTSLKIVFVSANQAEITDCTGSKAIVIFDGENVEVL